MKTNVKLPDGSNMEYDRQVTAHDVAGDISPGLARAAVAAEVDELLCDLNQPLPEGDCELKLVTDRDTEGLMVLRHTAAHVLADAVVRLCGAKVQYTIGPPLVDDYQYGFYYDFDLPRPVGAEDLPKIEQEMRKIVSEKTPIRREEMPVEEAKEFFRRRGQEYKLEMIDDLVRDEGVEKVSFYRQGEFVDMCRGPHLPHTGKLGKAFKLLATAGAYWRGDESKKMLTRIYGTAFFDKKDLQEQLERVEEAKKRDHRVLGRELELFTFSEKIGPGLPLWLPKGAVVRMELENWLRGELTNRGYQAVISPHVGKLDLWRTSGHYPYYEHGLFPTMVPAANAPGKELIDSLNDLIGKNGEQNTDELAEEHKLVEAAGIDPQRYPFGEQAWERLAKAKYLAAPRDENGRLDGMLVKPMNCPFHIQVYKNKQRSYRELPLRLSEFGTVYRYEQSGELSGLTRVRGFTQDDAHIFCTPEQLEAEIESCVELSKVCLGTLGLDEYRVRVGLRDPDNAKYTGPQENWDLAEKNIRRVVRDMGMDFTEETGEAAFYGPKIDFVVKDCIGRDWQLGTIQVDYNIPQRFELEYIGTDNSPHRPVLIHRAPFGSMERFVGILIEHFGGAFPLWLAPVQVSVLPVSDKYSQYGREVVEKFRHAGLRVEFDSSPEKIGAKIRRATLAKIPYMAVVGQKEAEAGTVAVRRRTEGDTGQRDVAEFAYNLMTEVRTRALFPPPSDS